MKNLTLILLLINMTPLQSEEFEIQDPDAFDQCVSREARITKLAEGFSFIEGPVWLNSDGGFLVFSDIPRNELLRWDLKNGITTFRKPSQNSNGNTLDREGRLLSCEHSGRRISILQASGELQTLVDQFESKKFNSPNDAVVKSDGSVWFTDPDYGLPRDQPREQPGHFVYRFDPQTQNIKAVVRDFDKPNGLAFSPDESILYIADSGKPRHIRVFQVKRGGTLEDAGVFATFEKGVPDGIRVDKEGRVWSSAGDGIQIFAPDGRKIGAILVPESPANLCFGGEKGNTLFMTARTGLYCIPVLVTGAGR